MANRNRIKIGIIIIEVIAIGAVGYFIFSGKQIISPSTMNSDGSSPTSTADISGWQIFRLNVWDSNDSNRQIGKVEMEYPSGFNASKAGCLGYDCSEAEIKNFDWQKDSYSFPYIRPIASDRFFMQIWFYKNIQKLSVGSWLKNGLQEGYFSPERVQIIGDYKNLTGTLVSQKQLVVDGKDAIQRTVLYQGGDPTNDITITYTYVNEGDLVFQFISHASGQGVLKIYDRILSTFKFVSQ